MMKQILKTFSFLSILMVIFVNTYAADLILKNNSKVHNDTSWQQYGNTITPGMENGISLIFNSTIPYLVSSHNYGSIDIRTIKNGVWTDPITSIYDGYAFSLATDPSPNGKLYIAYGVDGSSSGTVNVEKFNGETWSPIGNTIAANGSIYPNSLTVSSHGIPFLFYADSDSYGHVVTYDKDKNAWIAVGNKISLTSSFRLAELSIGINAQNIPYIVWCNQDSSEIIVMTLKNGIWTIVGQPIQAASPISGTYSFAMSPTTGKPYIAFTTFKFYFSSKTLYQMQK